MSMNYQHTTTNLPEENEYPKLIRDLIPEVVKQADGVEVKTRVLDDAEYEQFLRQKVVEEATELQYADTDHNLAEEIADVRELLDTIEKLKGISTEQMKSIQAEKRQKRGGFEKRLLMLEAAKR